MKTDCDDFVRKPFKESEIFEMMHKHLDLQYLYTESAMSPDCSPIKPPDLCFNALPVDLLNRLEKAAESIDADLVDGITEEIRIVDDDLADGLAVLANDFDYGKIMDFVRKSRKCIK